MREIKFRCWDKCNKEMLEVQELDYENSYNGQPMVRTTMYNDYFDTEDMILMQYTGLKDKNGKEIYEGDIVNYKDRISEKEDIFIVKYCKERAAFILSNETFDEMTINVKNAIIVAEVVGNIYENPELLKGE